LKKKNGLEIENDNLINQFQIGVASALYIVKKMIENNILINNNSSILLTGGGFSVNPYYEYTALSIVKSGIKTLAYTLNQELKNKNIFVGTVTINGAIEKGSKYDPEILAGFYWDLYCNKDKVEISY